MAVQFHTAHAQLVHGVAALAAPPYFCAVGAIANALGRCMKDGASIPVEQLRERAEQFAETGAIDPLDDMRGDRVWLYRGAGDPVVHSSVADALERYYRTYAGKATLARVERAGAGHNFPVAAAGASKCETSEPPYIASCDYDAARALLQHLYGPLANNGAPEATGTLREFDQRPYAQISESAGLDERGWLYVPAACSATKAGARCRLHVVFHGCRQGASFVEDRFARGAGYLESATSNKIVLLFPQVKPTTAPLNPLGCWDWWGYEGPEYATKQGRQIRAVRAMIGDLIAEPSAGPGASH